MAIGRGDGVARDLASLFGLGATGSLTDGTLLERFVDGERSASEQAFSTLVERHGRMVLAVCRSVLRDEHDALDAFQASFLVLARKAASLEPAGSLGPWMHQVALRAARAARSSRARRVGHEQKASRRTSEGVEPPDGLGLDAAAVHEEVGRLPARYRAPVVLCELEGLPLEQAARDLGCPVGTIKSRLARGRLLLRERLAVRGLDPARAVGVALGVGRISVPAETADAIPRIAALVHAGRGLAAGVANATAIESASLVLRSLSMLKVKAVLLSSVAATLIAAGAVARPGQDPGAGQVRLLETPAPTVKTETSEVPDPRPPANTPGNAQSIESKLDELNARLRRLESADTTPPPKFIRPFRDEDAPEAVAGLKVQDDPRPRPDSVPAPVLRNIKVDGDLDDWPVAMPRFTLGRILPMMQPRDEVGPDGVRDADPATSPDCSAAFSVGYDPTTQLIYLAVIVRDDQLVVGHTSHLDTDALEVCVDGLRSDRTIPQPGDAAFAGSAPFDFPVLQYIGIPGMGPIYGRPQKTNPILTGGDLEKTKTRMAYRRKGDATIYEWAIQAFDEFPAKPTALAPGKRIGFDVAVADMDGSATDGVIASWIYWGPEWSGIKAIDAGSLGEIVLGK